MALIISAFAGEPPAAASTSGSTNAMLLSAGEMTRPDNAVILWNGKDLTGWTSYFTNQVSLPALWSASNGVLCVVGKPFGYLRTENAYSNFHLHAEWRWPDNNPKDNSGVFVHMNRPEAVWPVAVECQLKTGSAGEMVGLGNVDFNAPLINGRKRAKITLSTEHPMGEWNSYDIYCRSNTIETFVNGVRQKFVEQVSVSIGNVGLQLEGYAVEFRNLWLVPVLEK